MTLTPGGVSCDLLRAPQRDLFGADDGYDSDLAQDYAESSSSVEAPEDTEFFGWYELHSNHWYNDFFICGSDMLEEDRVLEFEIT